MKNIHILPTDKPSRLVLDDTTQQLILINKGEALWGNRNIYITSDEEIKVGDWFLPQGHINPHKLKEYNKINGDLESYNGLCYDISKCKKIILTTDQDLIKDGVQAIDDEFLEWFVKNPSCEEVEVSYDKDAFPYGVKTAKGYGWYKIIIPKEEPKQETLEEAAENTTKKYINEREKQTAYLEFIEGAKWQAERMYNEADKIMKFLDTEVELKLSDKKTIERIKWYFETYFEQFKKK